MKYKLPIRRINQSDIHADCPSMPEEGEFETYLDALKEDIQKLDVVISLIEKAGTLIFEIESELSFDTLHSSVGRLLREKYWTKLRAEEPGFEEVK